MTGTPRVSSTSSVLGRSRIALAPAATTVTGVCASSCRSAEMSKLVSAPAMHAADAAGGKDLDPGQMRGDHRGGDGGGAGAAGGQAGGQIGARQFGDALWPGQARSSCVVVSPICSVPVEHRDGRRNRAGVADLRLDLRRGLEVLRIGHAVGDDGAFQRDQRACPSRGRSATSGG